MLTLEYIAGFFDGEGWITGTSPRYPRVLIGIDNTDLRILEDIAQELGGDVRKRKTRINARPTWRPSWEWHLCGIKAINVLQRLLPHLRVKREQAEIAIRLQAHIDRHRKKLGIRLGDGVLIERRQISHQLAKAKLVTVTH